MTEQLHQFVPKKIEIEGVAPTWKPADEERVATYRLEVGHDIANSHLFFKEEEMPGIVGIGVVIGQVDADVETSGGPMPYILIKIPAFRVKIVNTENKPVVLERKG